MRKILLHILCASISISAFAQNNIDRSKAPKPGPAPAITIKDPAIFNLPNGMTVLVVENHKFPKISASLSIDRGPVVEGNKAGVMELMGQMLNEGTTKTPKDKFDLAIDQMGANVGLSSGGGFVSSLSRYFESSFMLMAEALKMPAFQLNVRNQTSNNLLLAVIGIQLLTNILLILMVWMKLG